MPLDLSPLWISLKTASVATVFAFIAGIAVAEVMFSYQGKGKGLIDGILTLPLVLPPIVTGFLLLLLFGRNSPIGQGLQQWGISIIFSWQATVIASTVVAFPLMYKTTLAAFEQIKKDLINCARTLGANENRIFWQIVLPLSWRGIVSGTILTFARALGEFGATLMLAGSIPGKTQTMPLAIYFAAEAGNMEEALIWVIILVAIALGVIVTINYWSDTDGWLEQLSDRLGASAISRWSLITSRWFSVFQSTHHIQAKNQRHFYQQLILEIEKDLPSFSLITTLNANNKLLGILGASGSGKSMTLRCIAGLETPSRGRIVLNGRILFDSDKNINLSCRQRRIGFVFQNYALFPHMRVARNIGFGLQHLPKEERRKQVQKYIDLMQLQGLEKRYPHQLSGGQQQRVALARALAIEPEAILLDEPLSALDNYLRSQIEQLLADVFANYQGVMLLVTHKLEEAYRVCEDLVILDHGQVIGAGYKEDIFRHPPNFKVAQLTECKNFSRLQIVDPYHIKAIDWHCRLQVVEQLNSSLTYVGIRAHHLRFVIKQETVNTFPCWLVRISETPYRITLYLKLNSSANHELDYHLQGEVFKEKWDKIKDHPFPWYVYLDPLQLILMPTL
ncbi:MAG: molybdate ABC transporter permease subunit [Moorea sp. SIO1G6]|uniref:molybdate ABC transporter permease subunit n=1 Tax=Moorena sp. SIO1G6 TaxID=2607840 RepID=UPI0013C141B3|nr:molybdate ABC transporter permease subunit [Moorena sp. SIO1G6]NEQ12539.1 molybdate ABC transporter permease subunit [Moorena sp. SIO3E2]NES81195.1 molybdate ABC transporter permease subunit [Moorena sp. SIO2B7]NET69199.1 molybdate ABC transporter permease subunit [Moorena sp. SIO1G6]